MNLVLSDGTSSRDLFAGNIRVGKDLDLPTPGREMTYAESADSEGRRRVRWRPTNPEGSIPLLIFEDNFPDFWALVDELQELVESAHREKGTLAYTPPNGDTVTFDLEAITITGLPQRGVSLLSCNCEATVAFECRPYGRLATVNLTPASS